MRKMPQPNDAEFTHLYTASTGLDVEDNEPNTPAAGGAAPATSFDLHVEAVAGNTLGGSGVNYVLTLTCIDDVTAAPNAAMSSAFSQQFLAADGWKSGGAAGNFVKEQVIPVPIPANVGGHVFHYEGRLVSVDNQVISFIQSNRFILV
jgi:hypothetical protein